jgi:GntR family transcriptional repressor for pyruvate dehydrogenase complex
MSTGSPSARRGRGEGTVSRLRRDILCGRYRPGTRLPPERELAARLGTNRNTLREALRVLESENLVRARQGDGTRILDWRAGGEINLLPHFLAEETPLGERFDELLSLLNLRQRLLDEALGAAVAHATPSDLDAVHEALARLHDVERGLPAVAADIDLYRRIVLASHSLVLIWTFNTFARIFLELGQRFPRLWQLDAPYLDGLAQVVHWLEERRADRARQEMGHVFEERGMQLVATLRAGGEPPRARKPRPRP